MSLPGRVGPANSLEGGLAPRLGGTATSAERWLSLAAAPTFAAMALLAGTPASHAAEMVCSAGQHASPLSGMVVMYLLMSAFHSPPWWRLMGGRRRGVRLRP